MCFLLLKGLPQHNDDRMYQTERIQSTNEQVQNIEHSFTHAIEIPKVIKFHELICQIYRTLTAGNRRMLVPILGRCYIFHPEKGRVK